MSQFRTPTVLALCQSMRESQDWSAAPILADALQDAEYPNEEDLTVLRNPDTDPILIKRIVAIVFSHETNLAVRWIEAHGAYLGESFASRWDELTPEFNWETHEYDGASLRPGTYHQMMIDAEHFLKTGDMVTEWGSETWRNGFKPEKFWECYEKIVGKKPQFLEEVWTSYPGHFYGCSC